jgi:uncharacterized protein YndB with AHSA1/START domain
MGIDVSAEVTIRRPRPEVTAYMTDPSHDPEWIGGIRRAKLLGEGPVGVGSQVEREASFLGRKIEYVNQIVRLDEGVLEMRSVVSPFPMEITYTFEDRDGGTLVRNHVRGGSRGLFSLASPLMAPMVRRNVKKDLERLRDLLERRA